MTSTLKTTLTTARKNSGFSIENGILHYSGTAEDFSSAIKSKIKSDPTIDGQISLKNAAGDLVVISIKQGVLQNGKKTKAAKDPNAPKRPLTSFFFFIKEKRPSVVAAHPDAKAPEIGKLLGVEWAKLTPAQKKPYEDKAAAAKIQYQTTLAAYKAGGSASAAAASQSESEEESEEEDEAPAAKPKVTKKAAKPAEAPVKSAKKATKPAAEAPAKVAKKPAKKAAPKA